MPKATAVRVNREEERSSVTPGPSQPPGSLPGVCSHFDHYEAYGGGGDQGFMIKIVAKN